MDYILQIISRHQRTDGQEIVPYELDGETVIGVLRDEPYSIAFRNLTSSRVQVRLSVDGLDVASGGLATTNPTGDFWMARPYETMVLDAWPESNSSGGRFVFRDVAASVAEHTAGVTSSVGYVAAAIFVEGYVPPPARVRPLGLAHDYDILRGAERGGSPMRGPHGSGGGGYSFGGGGGDLLGSRGGAYDEVPDMPPATMGLNEATSAPKSVAATGVGERVEQRITHVEGFRDPKYKAAVRLRYLWAEELDARLRLAGVGASPPTSMPGFPGNDRPGINLGSTPRMPSTATASFQRTRRFSPAPAHAYR